MYDMPKPYPCPYYGSTPTYNAANMYNSYNMYKCPYFANMPMFSPDFSKQPASQCIPYAFQGKAGTSVELKDHGPNPFAVNIEEAARQNNNFRIALWTGDHLQLTLMSIKPGEDIGLEMHPNLDQFIRIEEGQGLVKMGGSKDRLDFKANVRDDYVFIIPAGKWHNLINTSNTPLKIYSIYAPPEHPYGTVHKTKEDAQEHHAH